MSSTESPKRAAAEMAVETTRAAAHAARMARCAAERAIYNRGVDMAAAVAAVETAKAAEAEAMAANRAAVSAMQPYALGDAMRAAGISRR